MAPIRLEDKIERCIVIGQVFRVALLEADLQSFCLGARLCLGNQVCGNVDPGDMTPGERSGKGKLTRAAGNVEYLLARGDIQFSKELQRARFEIFGKVPVVT